MKLKTIFLGMLIPIIIGNFNSLSNRNSKNFSYQTNINLNKQTLSSQENNTSEFIQSITRQFKQNFYKLNYKNITDVLKNDYDWTKFWNENISLNSNFYLLVQRMEELGYWNALKYKNVVYDDRTRLINDATTDFKNQIKILFHFLITMGILSDLLRYFIENNQMNIALKDSNINNIADIFENVIINFEKIDFVKYQDWNSFTKKSSFLNMIKSWKIKKIVNQAKNGNFDHVLFTDFTRLSINNLRIEQTSKYLTELLYNTWYHYEEWEKTVKDSVLFKSKNEEMVKFNYNGFLYSAWYNLFTHYKLVLNLYPLHNFDLTMFQTALVNRIKNFFQKSHDWNLTTANTGKEVLNKARIELTNLLQSVGFDSERVKIDLKYNTYNIKNQYQNHTWALNVNIDEKNIPNDKTEIKIRLENIRQG